MYFNINCAVPLSMLCLVTNMAIQMHPVLHNNGHVHKCHLHKYHQEQETNCLPLGFNIPQNTEVIVG